MQTILERKNVLLLNIYEGPIGAKLDDVYQLCKEQSGWIFRGMTNYGYNGHHNTEDLAIKSIKQDESLKIVTF